MLSSPHFSFSCGFFTAYSFLEQLLIEMAIPAGAHHFALAKPAPGGGPEYR